MPPRPRRNQALRSNQAGMGSIPTVRSLVQRMQSQLNMLKPEKKQAVFTYSQQTIDSAGRDDTFNGLAQGTDQNQRVGNSVKYTGIWGRFSLYFADSPNFVRVIVYSPKNEGDLMTTDAITVTGIYDMDKYNVYFDKLFSGDGTAGPATKAFTIKKRWKRGKKQQYDGTTAADMVKGRMNIFLVSDSGAVAHPYITGSLRIFYLDV